MWLMENLLSIEVFSLSLCIFICPLMKIVFSNHSFHKSSSRWKKKDILLSDHIQLIFSTRLLFLCKSQYENWVLLDIIFQNMLINHDSWNVERVLLLDGDIWSSKMNCSIQYPKTGYHEFSLDLLWWYYLLNVIWGP